MRQWRRMSNIILMATNAKNEMRMYLLVAARPLMSIARCSVSSTTLMIGAPGPCGRCSWSSSWSNLSRGIWTPPRLLFQGVRPVMSSMCPLTNLLNWARRAGSSRGFLLGPVYAGGALPPLPPLPLPGVLDPRHVLVDNLRLLEETLLNRDVDWSVDQSSGDVSTWEFLQKTLVRLGFHLL